MIEIYLVAAIALVAAGVVIGVVAVVSLGIRREEKAFSLTTDITHRVARGARVLNGLHTRSVCDLARKGPASTSRTLWFSRSGTAPGGVSGPASR
jgi:hypothetical protein